MDKIAVKLLKIVFVIASAVAAVLFIGAEIMKLPMNSDSACMMLEARDILSGNIFLSDWNLTGISFITTDLPWYILGTAVFGVGLNAFRLSVFLMYIFMAVCALLPVIYKAEDKFLSYCIFLGLGAIPTVYALSNAFVHTAGFALSFLLIFAVQLYNDNPKKSRLAFIIALCALAVCGDRSSLAVAVVPLIAVSLCGGVNKPKAVSLGLISGSAIGFLIEKIFLAPGGAELNSLSRTSFAVFSDITSNIRIYIDYFLRLVNSRFFGKELFTLKTGVFALKIIIVLFAFYAIFLSLRSLVRKEESDIAISALGIGFLLISLMLFLTTMNSDLTSGRYIAFLPFLLAVTVARTIDISPPKGLFNYALCVLFVLLAVANIMPHGSSFSPENTYSRLSEFLLDEGLTEGYGAFWDSTVVDAYSGGAVHISPVRAGEEGVEPRRWFCKNSWYKGGNFVVVRREKADSEEQNYNYNGIFNMHLAPIEQIGGTSEKPFTYDAIIETFGQPESVLHFEIYDILIYDRIEF
mgnify:CR=1 FL=1